MKKLTREERAEELIGRFRDLELPIGYSYLVRCALEVAKENIFISSKDYNAEWSNRQKYWQDIKIILENKLK